MKAHHLLLEQELFEHQIYKRSYRAGRMLVEAELTAKQIDDIFRAVADGAAKGMNNDTGVEGGASNRTMIGKGADMVSAVRDAFTGVKDAISKSGPVKGMDAFFDNAQQQLLMAAGGEEGTVSKALQRYRVFSEKYPIIKSGIKWGVTALIGLASAGLGGPALVAGIALLDRLLMGDKLSSAAWNALVTGGVAALVQWVSHHPTPGPDPHPAPPGPTPTPTDGPDYIVHVPTQEFPVNPDVPTPPHGPVPHPHGPVPHPHGPVPHDVTPTPTTVDPNAAPTDRFASMDRDLPQALNRPVAGTEFNNYAGNDVTDNAARAMASHSKVTADVWGGGKKAKGRKINEWIDRETTVRRWALSESLGKTRRRSVWLTEAGVEKIFEQVAIRSYLLNEAAGTRIEPTMDEPPAKTTAPAAETPAPKSTATPTEPPAPKAPAEPARGDRFSRPGAGTPGEAPMTGAEAGEKPGLLSRMWGGVKKAAAAGWDAATNKISYNTLGLEWRKINPNRGQKNADKMGADSEIVEKFLRQQGVTDALIRKVFESMGIPVSVAADVNAQSQAATPDAAQAATPDAATAGGAEAGAADARAAGGAGAPVSGPVDGTVFSKGSQGGAGADAGAAGGGAAQGTGTGTGADASKGKAGQGDGERSAATGSVLSQIARMRGPESADDLIDIADMALSVLFRANPAAYKEFLGRLRMGGASRPPRKAQDIIGGAQAGGMPPAPGVTGEVPAAPAATTAAPVAAAGGAKESRRVFGGKYIRESTVDKMHREFQQHLLNLS